MKVQSLVRTGIAAITAAVLAVPLALASPASAAATSQRVVSVGDSFASGEGAIGSGWEPDGTPGNDCHRSPIGGHKQAAGRFNGAVFTALGCSGAETGAPGRPLPAALGRLLGKGGQLAQINPNASGTVDALIMAIGGNDLDFADIVSSCALPYECYLDPAVTGGLATNLARLPGALASVVGALQGPSKTAPGQVRHVFVTEYPDPTTGVFGLRCGLPLAEPFQLFDFISFAEAEWASTAVVAPLNSALATMVSNANKTRGPTDPVWHFVSDVDDRFFTHGYCTGIDATEIPFNPLWWTRPRNFNPRYISTLVDSYSSQGDYRGAMHPNDLGQIQIADALEQAMDFLRQPQVVSVTPWSTPVAGTPVTLTVQVTDAGGHGVPGAPVWAGGNWFGTTDATGSVTASATFAAAGTGVVTADGNPFPAGSATITVAGQNYTVTASPAPIPVDTTIAQLVLTTTDASGAPVPGVFTLVDGRRSPNGVSILGTRTRTFRNGDVNTAWKVNQILVSGYPEPEMACPTLHFRPDSQMFVNKDVSSLIDC